MKILLVNCGYYPDKDAGSTRVTIFARMLKELGHDPVVAAYNKFDNYSVENINGIDYISLLPKMRDFKNSIKYVLDNKIVVPDVIWIYWAPLPAFIYLKNYAIKNKIQLVHDSVEWFSANGLKDKINYFYLERIFTNKYVINKKFKVIGISSYLENYYSSKKIKSIRIPILMDIKNYKVNKEYIKDDKIHLLYAGSPSRSKKSYKDDLKLVLSSMMALPKEVSSKFKFTIIGINSQQIIENYETNIDELDFEVEALGRISREEVLNQLNKAHFTILIRDANAVYAKAGFPTKVVESLMTGTPVICNLSSDLGLYLEDKVNSIIVKDNSINSLVASFTEISKLTQDEIEEISTKSYETALSNFDYRLYNQLLGDFIGLDKGE